MVSYSPVPTGRAARLVAAVCTAFRCEVFNGAMAVSGCQSLGGASCEPNCHKPSWALLGNSELTWLIPWRTRSILVAPVPGNCSPIDPETSTTISMFVRRSSGCQVLSTWYIKCSTIGGIAVAGTGGSPASVAAGGGVAGHVGPRRPAADTAALAG